MPTIAIIAPGAYAPNPEFARRAIQRLQQRGWTVKTLVDLDAKYLRFSADDATRLAQLNAAVDDPEVDVIMALRGGYGFSRILDQVDFARLASSGKLFVGFSDFTPLHCGLLAKAGAISFAGPMLYDDFGSEQQQDFTFAQFERCLFHDQYRFSVDVPGNPDFAAHGTFWGGNLTMLAHLVGTPYMPEVSDGILFLEDVNENPYRVERMILQLYHAGILSGQRALVMGHFTNYRSTDYDNGYDYSSMLDFIRSKTGIPVITGLPFGHCPNKVTLPIGAPVSLNSNAHQLTLAFTGYPHLSATSTQAI